MPIAIWHSRLNNRYWKAVNMIARQKHPAVKDFFDRGRLKVVFFLSNTVYPSKYHNAQFNFVRHYYDFRLHNWKPSCQIIFYKISAYSPYILACKLVSLALSSLRTFDFSSANLFLFLEGDIITYFLKTTTTTTTTTTTICSQVVVSKILRLLLFLGGG